MFFIFFHLDYTIGLGVTPNHALYKPLADFTAGREFHPALKINSILV